MARSVPAHKPGLYGAQVITLEQAQRLRNTPRYRKFRRWFIARHPFCADPYGNHQKDGRIVASQHLHHVQKITDAPDLLCSSDNAMALCVACHNRIERVGYDHVANRPYR